MFRVAYLFHEISLKIFWTSFESPILFDEISSRFFDEFFVVDRDDSMRSHLILVECFDHLFSMSFHANCMAFNEFYLQ